jgi:Na+/H+-dicarboxylate symporter
MSESEKKRRLPGIYLLSLTAFLLGLALGFLTPGLFLRISFLGTVYLNLLKMIVIPLLMSEIAFTAASAAGGMGRNVLRTVGLFAAMFVVTYCITAVAVSLLKPGAGLDLFGGEWDGAVAAADLAGFFVSIFPSSIFKAMGEGSILPCILFSFAFGIAAKKTGSETVTAFLRESRDIFRKVLSWIMVLTPVGVFSLIGNSAAEYGSALFGVCARYILTAWLCFAVVMLLVMMLPVCVVQKIGPAEYFRRMAKVWVVSLSTCSSAATLPTTIRVCNEDFGGPEEVTGLVVPLGCTIHMCGGAVSFCLLGLFTLQMAGIPLTAGRFLYMLLVAILMNMAAPGIPGGGIVLGATYLTILGAPTGFIAMYGGIYRILDMAYTTLNVTGDVTANVLIAGRTQKNG